MGEQPVPERLRRGGRAVDPDLSPDESFFRAVRRNDLHDGRLFPDVIRFPYSVNKGKYSEPADVIRSPKPRPQSGVAEFKVGHVPVDDVEIQAARYAFRVEHVPEEDNYAHSEIRLYKDGRFLGEEQPKPRPVRLQLRVLFADRVRIELLVQPPDPPS
jgi:hypothetical protein